MATLTPNDIKWVRKTIDNAIASAKKRWGSGWTNLTSDMRKAYVCMEVVHAIDAADYETAFGAQVDSSGADKGKLAEQLFGRLLRIQVVCELVNEAGDEAGELKVKP